MLKNKKLFFFLLPIITLFFANLSFGQNLPCKSEDYYDEASYNTSTGLYDFCIDHVTGTRYTPMATYGGGYKGSTDTVPPDLGSDIKGTGPDGTKIKVEGPTGTTITVIGPDGTRVTGTLAPGTTISGTGPDGATATIIGPDGTKVTGTVVSVTGAPGSGSGRNNSPNVFDLDQLAPHNGSTNRILDNLLNYSAGIAIIIAVFFIIYGGYQIMMAGDDPGKFESGVKTIKYTIIGLLVIFLSGAIVNFVAERILDVNIN